MGDLVGQSLAHFRIVEKLGEGGMGVVYRATDEKLRRSVALKVLPDSFAQDADRRRRFLREARSAAAVTHANIATVHDVGEADGHVFIAMELVEGETLRARLEKGLSVAESVRIAKEIARGLARAHEKGIVHRDLKPENVMISRHDEVKILDFGLAKLREEQAATASALEEQDTATELTREGKLLGTPGYMSPEQARGQEVDARTDVFAFGVVLYEMVTGERPFVGETAQDVLIAVARDTPKRASVVNPLVPEHVDRIVERCLEKLRDARFANGTELLEALHAILSVPHASEATSARKGPSAPTVSLLTPEPSAVGIRSRARLRWGLVMLGGLAVVGLGLGYRARGTPSASHAEPSVAASASASAPAPVATTLADLPPPPTKVPEAATEYAAGMQALHDNSWFLAERHFERALDLDPTLAIAHLRVAMTAFAGTEDPTRMREEFAKAAPLRAQLSPRDRVLLEALEPVLQRLHGDRQEAVARLERASLEYPSDVEFFDWLGLLQPGNPRAALPASERAIELDPRDGQGWQNKGDSLVLLGRTEEAHATFERCAAIAVDSTDCLGDIVRLDANEGRCEAYEADSRRLLDRLPEAAFRLANAMLAKGRPVSATLDLLDQATEAIESDPNKRTIAKAGIRAALAVFAGDFMQSEELERQLLSAVSSNPKIRTISFERRGALLWLLETLHEIGKEDEARKVAVDFFAQGTESWNTFSQMSSVDLSLPLLRWTVGPGGLAPAAFEERRAAWITEQLTTLGTYPGFVWTYAYAAPALTSDEARTALAALPRFAPLGSYLLGNMEPDAYAGRTYLLAGKPEEAIGYLKRAVANCEVLWFVFFRMHAALDLGQALEATKDTQGACAAYKLVLDRWGHAKPRSVTADKARERSKALACPP
jgi:eukaryotic-like serine/threonine-protein kinase